MSFLSNKSIKDLKPKPINPFEPEALNQGAYELTLGEEIYITANKNRTKKVLTQGEQIAIPAGQFALLTTKETLHIPNDLIAFISIKFSQKIRGLVNISGFHVDPGFKGILKFSVYNAGGHDIVLTEGCPLFLIWFAEFDQAMEESDLYHGSHQDQAGISDEDVMNIGGEIPSPNQLKREIEKIRLLLKTLLLIAIPIFVALVLMIVSRFVKPSTDNEKDPLRIELQIDNSLLDSLIAQKVDAFVRVPAKASTTEISEPDSVR